MSNLVQVPLKVPEEVLKAFDKECEGRTRMFVLRKLMAMYSKGYIDVDWSKDYSVQNQIRSR